MTRAVAAVLVLSSCSTAASRRPATHELRVDEPTVATTTTTTTTTTSTTTATTAVPTTTAVVARKARASRSAERSRPPPTVTPSRPDAGPDVDGLDWAALRRCESGGDYHNRRNPRYRGGYQFLRSTWAAMGGHGDPADAEPAEQDMRAAMLFAAAGRRPWPVCGRLL